MASHLPRLGLGLLAVLTLVLSVGGAVGVWPTGAPASRWDHSVAQPAGAARSQAALRPAAARVVTRDMEGPHGAIQRTEATDAQGGAQGGADSGSGNPATGADTALPPRSGSGRRVVFDQEEQRVWLVGPAGKVRRTYPVSGSRTDNLDPGHYEVYSRSRHAVSYTYEETMQYMVRFTQGEQAAIGFHDIPVDQRGRPVQTRAQLGERLSSGCIRQARPDAIALWRFADVGTDVVVVD
ncbi:MAG TPA: L,D-transpeptidase [Nocardioidaceae bacterium]|nr:L,D-transpeptidase [Nocardioidaceae bacterium]